MPAASAVALAAFLVVGGPLLSPLERRILRADLDTRQKLLVFAVNMTVAWGIASAAVWAFGMKAVMVPGEAGSTWLGNLPYVGPAIGGLLGAYFGLCLLPLIQSLRGPRLRTAYAAAIRRHAKDFPSLLPDNAAERLGFVLVSLTAGVCEEILFRGFLMRFLQESQLHLPLVGALLISSAAFGLNHLYQGAKGVVGTTVGGLAFGLLFLLTGSLVLPILLHVAVDAQIAFVLRPAKDATAVETA